MNFEDNPRDYALIDETEEGDIGVDPEAVDEFGWTKMSNADGGGFGFTLEHEQDSPTELTASERIDMGFQRAGFYSHSPRELNHTIGVLEEVDTPGGVGRYLNNILKHQNKSVSEDPEQALRKIVNEMGSYAKSAQASKTMLEFLKQELPAGSNLESLQRSSSITDWQHQPTTHRALAMLVQRRQIEEAARTEEYRRYEEVKQAYIVDEVTISNLVKNLRSGQAKALINQLQQEETRRAEFWQEALRSAQSHMVVSSMAKTILSGLKPVE